jgi:thiamine-phosphate pyrophosphorylase
MTAHQTVWPRAWLMTDERLGDRLVSAIERLPDRSGVIFRHYSLPPHERRALAEQVATICRGRGLILGVASDTGLARALGADLVHNPERTPSELPFSRAVHSLTEAKAAASNKASLVFVSPVHATRSHPGRRPLGPELAAQIARAARAPAIALGGMNARRFAELEGFHGWAGIDAWLGRADA